MDSRERLRMALIHIGCSRCGQPYPVACVNILAQRDGIAFVQLECPSCAIRILAVVTGSPETDEELESVEWTSGTSAAPADRSQRRRDGARRVEASPIDSDDVLEMHRFLEGYEGDIRGLFSRARDDEDDRPRRPGRGDGRE